MDDKQIEQAGEGPIEGEYRNVRVGRTEGRLPEGFAHGPDGTVKLLHVSVGDDGDHFAPGALDKAVRDFAAKTPRTFLESGRGVSVDVSKIDPRERLYRLTPVDPSGNALAGLSHIRPIDIDNVLIFRCPPSTSREVIGMMKVTIGNNFPDRKYVIISNDIDICTFTPDRRSVHSPGDRRPMRCPCGGVGRNHSRRQAFPVGLRALH